MSRGFVSRFAHSAGPMVPRCHASTIVEAGNGDLLCAFYGGSGESHPDEGHYLVRLSPGEDAWQPIRAWQKTPGHASGNIRLFAHEGDVCAVYAVNYGAWCRGGSRLYFSRSRDHGLTWSEPARIDVGLPVLGKNKALVLAGGRILLPCEREVSDDAPNPPPMGVLASDDGGLTWREGRRIRAEDGHRIYQGAVAQRSDGTLLMLMRSDGGRIYRVLGEPDGTSWQPVAERTSLRNNHSGIDLVRLQSGRLALAYNDREGTRPDSATRTPLNVALSEDDGDSWPHQIALEEGEGEFSYPAIIQDGGGSIHVTYTWHRTHIKHVALTEAAFGL